MFFWFSFSHHPLCKNYSREVIDFQGIYICRGCFEVYSSWLIFGTILTFFSPLKTIQVDLILLIAVLSLSPSIIGNFVHFRSRFIKDFIRIVLGIGLGFWLSEIIILPGIITKIELFVVFLIMYMIFKFTRQLGTKNTKLLLCQDCAQFSNNACENYKKVFTTEGLYSRILSDYIQKKLTINQLNQIGIHQ